MPDRDAAFSEYVLARRGALLRTATLLVSGDGHRAEDLVQIALTRLYTAWPRVSRMDVDAYVRRILVNALIDEKRRPFSRRESLWSEPPEPAQQDDADPGIDDADLHSALAKLPPGMRVAVVLRHVQGLSVSRPPQRCAAAPAPSRARPHEVWTSCARCSPSPHAYPTERTSTEHVDHSGEGDHQ